MFKKLSLLVPTRKRVDRLERMLSSFVTTVGASSQIELVLRLDDDDRRSYEILASLGYILVVGPRLQGYTSMPAFFNEMAAVATGDVLMVGNDDMVFKTPGWPALILEEANKFPDGLFDIGISTFNEDHYPFAITSKIVADHLGFFWDPRIFWGDIYLRDVMGTLGRTVKLPSVEVDHEWAGHAPDEVFVEARQNEIYNRDPTYWAGTHATAVAEAVAKLKELIA